MESFFWLNKYTTAFKGPANDSMANKVTINSEEPIYTGSHIPAL